MIKDKGGAWVRTTQDCNLLELKELRYFYWETHRTLRTPEIDKISGLKINGLRTPKSRDYEGGGHTFLWCESLLWGRCTCGGWELDGKPLSFSKIQHANHRRRGHVGEEGTVGNKTLSL